jgi:hypothetical protein
VFEHFVAEDQIEGRGREREKFSGCVNDMRRIGSSFGGALEVVFQPDNFPTKRGEVFKVHAYSTSIFENTSLDAFPRAPDDHFEPALLSCPPNVGWFAS